MNRFIRLKRVIVADFELRYEFESSLDLFRKNRFFIRYENRMPAPTESVAAVPFAALMAPVAWATGSRLVMPALDSEYLAGLEQASAYYKKCFPKWPFRSSRIETEAVRTARRPDSDACGMLFSGGLDSLATLVANLDKKPELFAVIGADIPLDRVAFIASCKNGLFKPAAARAGVPLTYIHTDIRQVLDTKKLERFARKWYATVQFGPTLTALTAPVTVGRLSRLLIASCSHKPDYSSPCAGEPEVVEPLRWAGTRVETTLHELSRVDKVREALKPNPEYLRYLRVCWAQHQKLNCSGCNKCYRTICELLVNNVDPNQANFQVTPFTLKKLRAKMLHTYNLFFRGDEGILNFWRTIRESIRLDEIEDMYGSREFFEWLAGYSRLEKKQSPFWTRVHVVSEKISTIAQPALVS